VSNFIEGLSVSGEIINEMKDKIEITDSKVIINGITYLPENQQKSPNYEGDIKIVVLQRGWVYIGRFTKD